MAIDKKKHLIVGFIIALIGTAIWWNAYIGFYSVTPLPPYGNKQSYAVANADVELYVNDVLVASQYNIAGSGTTSTITITSTLSTGAFAEGSTIRTRIAYWCPQRKDATAHITATVMQAQYNTTTDNVIATGSAAFICTDADNAQYSLE